LTGIINVTKIRFFKFNIVKGNFKRYKSKSCCISDASVFICDILGYMIVKLDIVTINPSKRGN